MTTKQLAALNPKITDINRIYPGQVLNVGDGTGTATKTTTAKATKTTTAKAAKTTTAPATKTARRDVVAQTQPMAASTAASSTASGEKRCAACDNVINGNPLYRPAEGRFYSVTSLESDTSFKPYALNEQFGFGITDRLAVSLSTTGSTSDTFKSGTFGWDNFGLGASFRWLNDTNWKGDVYGTLSANRGMEKTWWNQDDNFYIWTAGAKFGYATCTWTVNGLFEYDYANTGAFNWNDQGQHLYKVGLEGQYAFNEDWNVTASVLYWMPNFSDANFFSGKLGLNYNIDTTKYVGAYVFQTLDNDNKFADDTGLGLQFGIDF